MRRNEQKLILTVQTNDPRPLRAEQMQMLADWLAGRFKDASFQIEAAPSYMRFWHPTQLSAKQREVYEILSKATDWVRLMDRYPQARVIVHRLNHNLPDYLRVIMKRNHGYKLVDLREEI